MAAVDAGPFLLHGRPDVANAGHGGGRPRLLDDRDCVGAGPLE
jgi:hypothetical protein